MLNVFLTAPVLLILDAEPKYLIAVQPIPANEVKKQCTGVDKNHLQGDVVNKTFEETVRGNEELICFQVKWSCRSRCIWSLGQ